MIINDLFPTTSTFTQGLQNQYTGELAENFGGGTPVVNSLDSYWLGYISRDNLPLQYTMGAVYVDTDAGVFVCKDVTDKSNFPCTYVRHGYQSGQSQYNRVRLSKSVNGGTPEITYASVRPFNQLYPEYAGMDYNSITGFKYALTIDARAMVFDGGGNLLTVDSYNNPNGQTGIYFYYDGTGVSPAYGNRMIKAAYDFLFKNAEVEIKIYVQSLGEYISFMCRASDFNDGGTAFLDNGTYTARIFLTSFSLHSFIRIYQNGYIDVLPLGFAVKTSNHYGENQYEYEISSIGSFIYPFIYSEISNVTAANPNLYFGCGFDDTFPISEITRIQSYTASSTGYPYGYTDNFLFSKSSPSVAIYPLVTIDQIRKTFSLSFRVDISGSHMPGYVEGFTYATDVTADNEFLAKLKTGDIEDPNYKNSLRPWQYENFQEDDFTEEDVPPYEPEPEPGGDTPSEEPEDMPHDEGDPAGLQDRTIPAPSLFITQYALTYEDVQAVGANLWQSWLTPNTDVWKNFFLPYSQDFGTLNIGAALDCIISLRAYPFDIPLDVLLPAANGVRMGTGHTDFLGYATSKVSASTCKIPLGDCVVKPKTPYEDFRDMYNTSVSCFLPYCGTVELNPPEVINRTLHCYYCIDLQSGGCTAFITLDGDEGEYIIASKSGQIGFLLPITATNAGQLAAQKGQDAVETIGTLAGFFFDVAGELAQSSENAIKALAGIESGKSDKDSVPIGTTLTSSLKIGESGVNTGLDLANQALKRLSRSGVGVPAISGGSGIEAIYAPDTAVISIRRGKYAKPINYPHSQAHLNGSSGQIGTFKGDWGKYTPKTGKGLCKFTGVDTTGLKCHDDERAEIVALLESGVYI